MNLFGYDLSTPVVIMGATAALVLILGILAWLKTLLQICPPNEVLILSGKKRRAADGGVRGYRVVFGGRSFRWPIIEKVSRMSLNVMEVPISIRGAYSQGGIPLNVEAIANVKISSDQATVGNAIERFLGRDPNEIRRVAKETLEGHLRGVLARLTPEEVNEDRLKFADELSRESELDLSKLGIHLDTFKVQHVSDEVRYLDSIGREAIAKVVMEAEMAESDAKRLAELAEAENMSRANVARANAESNIAKMKNELRKIQADLESQVRSEEERTTAAAREARAKAEQALQQLRAELEKIRLRTDSVLPAEAQLVAQTNRARGEAAILRERGLAVGQSLDLMTEAWNDAGDAALRIMLMEDIEKIVRNAGKGVAKIKIDDINIIDNGSGESLSAYMAAYPAMLQSVFSAVYQVTGIDIPGEISNPGTLAAERKK